MRRARTSDKGRDAGRELVSELARIVVQHVAPEELGLLGETEADYFRDPRLVLKSTRDEAVGFGLDMALLTPYVLVVGSAIVHFLATAVCGAVSDEVRDELRPMVAERVRLLLRRDDPAAPGHRESEHRAGVTGVTVQQARQVRRIALEQATRSGLDPERAALLADAFVGALLVSD